MENEVEVNMFLANVVEIRISRCMRSTSNWFSHPHLYSSRGLIRIPTLCTLSVLLLNLIPLKEGGRAPAKREFISWHGSLER